MRIFHEEDQEIICGERIGKALMQFNEEARIMEQRSVTLTKTLWWKDLADSSVRIFSKTGYTTTRTRESLDLKNAKKFNKAADAIENKLTEPKIISVISFLSEQFGNEPGEPQSPFIARFSIEATTLSDKWSEYMWHFIFNKVFMRPIPASETVDPALARQYFYEGIQHDLLTTLITISRKLFTSEGIKKIEQGKGWWAEYVRHWEVQQIAKARRARLDDVYKKQRIEAQPAPGISSAQPYGIPSLPSYMEGPRYFIEEEIRRQGVYSPAEVQLLRQKLAEGFTSIILPYAEIGKERRLTFAKKDPSGNLDQRTAQIYNESDLRRNMLYSADTGLLALMGRGEAVQPRSPYDPSQFMQASQDKQIYQGYSPPQPRPPFPPRQPPFEPGRPFPQEPFSYEGVRPVRKRIKRKKSRSAR